MVGRMFAARSLRTRVLTATLVGALGAGSLSVALDRLPDALAAASANVPAIRPHLTFDQSGDPLLSGITPGAPVTPLRPASSRVAGVDGPVVAGSALHPGGPQVLGFVQNGEVTSGDWQSDIDFNLVSTIAYFSIDVNSDGSLINDAGYQAWGSQQATDLFDAAHAAGDRVLATFTYLCGSSACDSGMNSLLNSASAESAFVSNVVAQVKSRGVDGVDIDFEPATGLGGDASQFTALMGQLKSALQQQVPNSSYLSVDVYTSAYQGGEIWAIPNLSAAVDSVDVMTYSENGPTQPNSPMGGPYTYTDPSVVNGFLAEMPASKLLLGIPYFGEVYSTTSTAFNAPLSSTSNENSPTYADILADFGCVSQQDGTAGPVINWDATSETPWAYWYGPTSNSACGSNNSTWRELYYDNGQSLGAKYSLVGADHLAGIGIWALGYDSGSNDLWSAIAASFTSLSTPPTNVAAASTASGAATVSWSPPADVSAAGVAGYSVITYNANRQQVGSAVTVSGGATTSTTVTGLADGAPLYFGVEADNGAGDSLPGYSNSVTPLSGVAPAAATTAVSTSQYLLPNSDGSTWQVMNASNLAFTMTPSSSEDVLLGANSDMWTENGGYNQDIGIQVTPERGSPTVAAWKESGGFAGTYSPNAAFVETVYPMNAGTTYTVQLVWKTNRSAIGATVAAGAGPIGSNFSPTRLTATVLPSGGYSTGVSTQQYSSINSNGSTWVEMDPGHLAATLVPSVSEDAVLSGNADLWTANAGYNQDLGIFVTDNGGSPTLLAWKESGGFAGTFSPNAAFVQTLYPMSAGHSYVFSLWWKANKPSQGTIFAGAGQSPTFSPTRITAYALPANTAPTQWATAVSTSQYSSINSNGSTWVEMDASHLATGSIAVPGGGSSESVLVSGNADLWTANNGYNQDLGIEVSEDGGTPTLVAWKESGGFAGTFSPNAAFVQAVYTMDPGHSYVFSLWWKANEPAQGTIFAGAGPIGSAYSPTRLSVVPTG